ncbi:hypothetical protein K1T71_000679 [Dendrolimus kikuchii]|uniref:Uncharacterized protein n=1 Tax=Dendrolimus kikuchii TaxID=765133 RepID=A0ACC1DK33_9NEOP|nr:hypothetical protein K1T71_000679 [Dendrolimus kikuchii]
MNLKVCRLCCDNNGTANIFQNDTQIYEKLLHCCVNIKIHEWDELPAGICGSCQEDLDSCYQFILKCESSDKKLRSNVCPTVNQIPKFEPKVEVKVEFENSDEPTYFDEVLPNDNKPTDLIKEHITKRKYTKRKKHKNSDSVCLTCGKKCSSPSVLVIHMRSHTNEKPYQCASCVKRYKDRGSLNRHIERNHVTTKRENKFICETCGNKFSSKHSIKIHLRTHTGETPHACTFCPKRFTQISSLLRHKMRHTGVRPHKCVVCSKKFYTKVELKSHAAVHTSEKNFSCPICNVTFKYLSNVKKHVNLKHNHPRSFICNQCGRTFNTKGALKSHSDRHHSEKSGYCDVCSKNVANIEVHTLRHTGERPLKCEHCSSSFFQLRDLNHHMNFKHTQTDKYKCSAEGCTMCFPSKPMLDFHTAKVHSTEIPFPCDKCSRGFYRKNDLARHKLGTHKERLL